MNFDSIQHSSVLSHSCEKYYFSLISIQLQVPLCMFCFAGVVIIFCSSVLVYPITGCKTANMHGTTFLESLSETMLIIYSYGLLFLHINVCHDMIHTSERSNCHVVCLCRNEVHLNISYEVQEVCYLTSNTHGTSK